MSELFREFKLEARQLIDQCLEMLEGMEEGEVEFKDLAEVGLLADRLYGASSSLNANQNFLQHLQLFSELSSLVKALSYRGSKIKENKSLVQVLVGFLFEAIEFQSEVLESLNSENDLDAAQLRTYSVFKARLEWFLETHCNEGPRSAQVVFYESEREAVKSLARLLNQLNKQKK